MAAYYNEFDPYAAQWLRNLIAAGLIAPGEVRRILIGVVGLQTAGGLFGNDDIAFQGPLYNLVSKETSDWITGLHRKGFWLVGLLVALHLAAIAFYTRVKKESLVAPMLTGRKEVGPHERDTEPTGGGPVALIFALAVGCAAAWLASGVWQPPPPPAPAAAPAW